MARNSTKRKLIVFSILAIALFIKINNVSLVSKKSDKEFIDNFLSKNNLSLAANATEIQKLEFVKEVQNIVLLEVKHKYNGIPKNTERSIEKILIGRVGECYDRSYLIERILYYKGFDVRHASIYYKVKNKGLIKTLLAGNSTSHATTEVKINNKWILVDSNTSQADLPISFETNLKSIQENKVQLDANNNDLLIRFDRDYYIIYGMYSRHGCFYPPYIPIPDFNFQQLFYNF